MKKISNAIDRFSYKHPGFGINNLMLFIVIGKAIVYVMSLIDRSGYFLGYLLFSPQMIIQGQVWRIITFIFIPNSMSPIFLLISLYFYYFIGTSLEREWGKAKFTLYYISGILFTVVYGMIAGLISRSSLLILADSTYINLSMFFVFATLYPENRVLLFFIIPIKIKWLAYVDAAFFAFGIIQYLAAGYFVLALLPVVAVLNYFFFCGDIIIERIGFLRARFFSRRPSNVINMKKAAERARAENEGRGYTHKCSVCGRTDADHPELEFRYCSRCVGFHCFCQDHIHSHVHFTE